MPGLIKALSRCGANVTYSSLHCLKAFGALFVIIIHFGSLGSKEYLYPLIRTAVPFFFIISGYFLYRESRTDAISKCTATLKKLLALTLYANLFCYLTGRHILPFHSVKHCIMLLHLGVDGHLWYLSAYVEVLIVVIVAMRLKCEKWLWGIAPWFVLMGLVMGRYNFLFDGIPNHLLLSRNFLTMGIPCFGIGWLLRKYRDQVLQHIRKPLLFLVVLFILSGIEAFVVLKYYRGYSGDYLVLTMPVAAALVYYCIQNPTLGCGTVLEYIGKHYSAEVYIFHMLIGRMLLKIIDSVGIARPHLLLPFLIFICTLGFVYIWRNTSKSVFK